MEGSNRTLLRLPLPRKGTLRRTAGSGWLPSLSPTPGYPSPPVSEDTPKKMSWAVDSEQKGTESLRLFESEALPGACVLECAGFIALTAWKMFGFVPSAVIIYHPLIKVDTLCLLPLPSLTLPIPISNATSSFCPWGEPSCICPRGNSPTLAPKSAQGDTSIEFSS